MKLFGPLAKAAALFGVVLALGAGPAFAGAQEDAALAAYIGTWKGEGKLTGYDAEKVSCRLQFRLGNQGKVNYSGRCTIAGRTLSVAGTVAYVDKNRQYEAAMSSNVGFNGNAVGKYQGGNNIFFDIKDKDRDEAGQDMEINSSMTLKGGTDINVNFKVTWTSTGDTITAVIPFKK